MKTIGEQLKEERIRQGLTQFELCQRLKIKPVTLIANEKGRANRKSMQLKIAKALKLKLVWPPID